MPQRYPRRGRECGPCGTYTMMGLAYECPDCGHFLNVPRCLVEETRRLHAKGVRVRRAGCLRWGEPGFIKVAPDDEAVMELFGYERIDMGTLGEIGESGCCFVPKTAMPAEKDPQRWEDWVRDHE